MKYIKNKYKTIISLFYSIFIIIAFLFILYTLFGTNFKYIYKSIEIFPYMRRLMSGFDIQKSEEICQKADKDLILLYQSDYYSYIGENSTIKKSTSYLLNYIKNKETSQIREYIFSYYAQIIMLIFEIVLIIIWIVFCYFISKNTYLYCFLKMPCEKNCLKNIFFIISISLYFIIIILSLILLFNIQIFLQDINNSFCSLFKISYHTYNGEENYYEMRPKWTGINQIKNLIRKTRQNLRDLINKNSLINNKINEIKKNKFFNPSNNHTFIESHINELCDLNLYKVQNPNPLNNKKISEFLFCSDILNIVEKEYNETFYTSIIEINDIYNILNDINNNIVKIELSFDNAKNKLDSFVKIIKDMEVEFFNSLVFIMETIVQKYLIYFSYFFFIFTFLLELAGVIIMIILKTCYSLFCNKVYNFIWNCQFLTLMIILLIVICSTSLMIFIDDISSIMNNSFDTDGIKENRTFSNNKYDIEGINTCIFKDGDLSHYLNLDNEAKYLSHFYSTINNINDNLIFYNNYEIISEKNETKDKFNELEKNSFLAKFKYEDNKISTNAEEILEKVLNAYTDNATNQELFENDYYSNYYFVFDKKFCKYNYKILFDNNQISYHYKNGKNCMILKDFPIQTDYFKNLKTINIEELGISYDLDNLVNMFKEKYYNNDGFESSFLNLLQNSKNYLENAINQESNKTKNDIITLYETLKSKINIIHELYKNILKQNSTDLFSAFNCNYLKRDFYIFLDQLNNHLNKSLYKSAVLCFLLCMFSFLSILFSLITIKLKKIKNKYEDDLFKPKEKDEKEEISEKPKIKSLHEKFNFDENNKSSIGENTGLKKKVKKKHVIDIDIEKIQ